MKKLLNLCVGMLVASALVFTGCKKDEPTPPAPKTYQLEVSATEGGSVTLMIDGTAVEELTQQLLPGTEVKVIATPDATSEFYQWAVEGVTLESDGTFEMPENDVTVEAEFGAPRHNVNVEGGTANPLRAVEGETVTLTFDQDAMPDYTFIKWLSEDVEVAADNTFTMPAKDVTLKAYVMATPTEPYLLYWDEEMGNLALGTWYDDATEEGVVTLENMLYTKVGSVIAVVAGDRTPTSRVDVEPLWNQDEQVKFNPTELSIDAWGTGMPCWGKAEWTAEVYDITPAAGYHTNENLAAGKGDICRLVGLTPDMAKEMLAAGTLASYDSGFRLMTMEEAKTMYGEATGENKDAYPWILDVVPGGMWPAATPTLSAFIPAAAYLFTSTGKINPSYTEEKFGAFWTANGLRPGETDPKWGYQNTGGSNTYAWAMEVDRGGTASGGNRVIGITGKNINYGLSARCTPNN